MIRYLLAFALFTAYSGRHMYPDFAKLANSVPEVSDDTTQF